MHVNDFKPAKIVSLHVNLKHIFLNYQALKSVFAFNNAIKSVTLVKNIVSTFA